MNPDDTITVYHSTTEEAAKLINKNGIIGPKVEDGFSFFTTNSKGYGGIGAGKNTVLEFHIKPNKLEFDDVFRGELHLKAHNDVIGGLLPTKKLETKAQLEAIWKKAQ